MIVGFGSMDVIGDLDQNHVSETVWTETQWEWVERIWRQRNWREIGDRDHRQLIQGVESFAMNGDRKMGQWVEGMWNQRKNI